MSRSNKSRRVKNLKMDIRKEKNRGFRRFVKLQIKAGEFYELPDAPKKVKSDKSSED